MSASLCCAPGLLALSVVLACAPGRAQDPSSLDLWRTARQCGVNALYLLARAHGHELDYATVVSATAVGPKGSSLAELRQAAERLGLDAFVGNGSPDDLAQADLPVVAHMDQVTGDVEGVGHYVLVTGFDAKAGSVTMFDGASALFSTIPASEFRRTWSGYVLGLEADSSRAAEVAISAASLLLGWAIYRRRRWAVGGAH